MKNTTLFFLCIFLVATSCKNSNEQKALAPEESNPEASTPTKAPAKLTVNLDNLRLRATPGEDGDEIARLSKGTVVYDLGEVSDFTTKIRLRGIQFDEPWVKVKTENDIEGWVYAGGLHFDLAANNQLSETLLGIRLQNIFGKSIARDLKIFRTDYDKATTSADFASAYRKGLGLRDTMVRILSEKIPEVDYEKMADLFWLESSMPGYKVQLVAEGTAYYLFNDYKKFDKKTRSTKGQEDDEMASLYLDLFEVDSIEYFYPSWFFQTWDYGGSSLLGRGIHLDLLTKMESNYENGLFNQEIDALRIRLINDITDPNSSYWESKDKILDEMKKILDKGFKQLSKQDVIALETRMKMFENPKANKIEMNLRAGN